MQRDLSVKEFEEILEECNYKIDPDDLQNLVSRLYRCDGNKMNILNDLARYVKSLGYEPTIYDDENPILDVYTSWSGLQFTIDTSLNLVLIEEMWYQKGSTCERFNFVVGKPDDETIEKIIKLYKKHGRGAYITNPSIKSLMSQ